MLPCVRKQVGHQVRLGAIEVDVDRAESFAPPELLACIRVSLNGGEDAGLVQHHVHVSVVPQGGEDPSGNAEGTAPVMILLDRAW